MKYKLFVLSLLLAAVVSAAHASESINLVLPKSASEPVLFAVGDLGKSVSDAGATMTRGTIADLSTPGRKVVAARAGTFMQIDQRLARLKVTVPVRAESFAIVRDGDATLIVGRDDTGVRYGLFELAERVRIDGLKGLDVSTPVVQSPYLAFRAVNPFITLKMPHDREWYFLSEDYWQGYIDMLARSRINWIDLHGMYNIVSGRFANMLPYFTESYKFSEVGVSKDEAMRNLRMMRKIVQMAHARGIRVGVMNYIGTWDTPENPRPSYPQTDTYLAEFTRETVAQFLRGVPELDMFGFRIGESGKDAEFYKKSYLQGIADSGTHPQLYTRTWGAEKGKIEDIVAQNGGPIRLEIKYNGEQYGPPYPIAGGRMSGWRDYSYQDFLSYPREYSVIWQVRVNGTHRVFRWGSPEWVARSVRAATLGDAEGISVEPINCYYPADDFLHKPGLKHDTIKWGYQRDWFFYNLWGRLAYDPNVGENVWLAEFHQRFGDQIGTALYHATVESSRIVPLGYTFHALGPDHREHAPELETGGDVRAWMKGQPFDTQVAESPQDYVAGLVSGKLSGKASPLDGARMIEEAVKASGQALDGIGKLTGEAECIAEDVRALDALGTYYASKLRAATDLALLVATGSRTYADDAMKRVDEARQGWHELATITGAHYQPFLESLRMNTAFTWAQQEPKLARDVKVVRDAAKKAKGGETIAQPDETNLPKIALTGATVQADGREKKTLTVTATVTSESPVKTVTLWHKPLPSETQWAGTPMVKSSGAYKASVQVDASGGMYYVEAVSATGGSMYPDFRKDTPYLVVKPWDARPVTAGTESGETGG